MFEEWESNSFFLSMYTHTRVRSRLMRSILMGKSPPRRPHEIIIIIPKFISKFYIKVNRISGPTTLIHYEKLDL